MVVGEAQMDKERGRGGHQKRSSASRVPLARRQHKLLSSVHLSGCNGKRHGVSGPVTGTGDDTRDGSTADGWRKGKATSDSGGSCYSSNDDGGVGMGGGGRCRSGDGDKEPGTPPIASTSSTRKRTKLNGKVSDGYVGVDPATVPRKLRSAMNKRVSGSFSSLLPRNGRKSDHLTSVSGNLPFGKAVEVEVGGSLTKDEEDAAQTLSAMAIMMVPEAEPAQVAALSLPKAEDVEKSDSKGSTSADNIEEDLFCSEKFSEGALPTSEPDIPKPASPVVVHQECYKLDLELNQPAEVDTKELDLMKIDPSPVDPNDSASFTVVDPVESMPILFLEKGVVGTPEKASSSSKPDVIVGLMEYPSAITLSLDAKHGVKPIHEEKPSHAMNVTCREEANLDVWMALPVADRGRLDTTCCSAEPGPSRDNTPTEKIRVLCSGRRQTWKKCATHVYIGYLIQRLQMTESKSQKPVPYKWPKLEAIAVINEVSMSQNSAKNLPLKETDNTTTDKKLFDLTTASVHDKRRKPVQQPQSMPGLCTQAKQNYDVVTFSAGSNLPNSGGKFDSVAKASTSPAPTFPPHSVVSFSLAPPYSSPYPDQLAAAAATAQQLQLTPQYLANPFYGFHMSPTGGPAKQQLQQTQQQQQMWQAHVTQYWMPPVLPKWQNGIPLDPSQSLIIHPQMPPVLSSSMEAKGIGASHQRPVIQHQTLPVPLQAVNRSK